MTRRRQRSPGLALALVLALLAGVGEAGAQGKGGKDQAVRIYVVRPGDSCWSIAQQVFGKGEAYRIIHRYNDLGPLPHLLRPGQKIRLPGSGSTPEAKVAWLRRDVRAKPPAMLDWLKAEPEMGLWRLYKVTTGSESSAGIRFEDASALRMRQRALLVIYGSTATRARVKRHTATTVVLEQGTVRGGLAALDQQADLKLRTPAAQVSLRSREAQVEVAPDKTSVVSVYDGTAAVSARGSEVQVPLDHGTFVKLGKRPAPPRPLPPAPRWAQGTGEMVVLVPPGHPGAFTARWLPVKAAKRYRVEVARDARFKIPIVDAVVGAGILEFAARELSPGTYHARVAAIDRARLEGRPSRKLLVRVLPLKASRKLHRPRSDGQFEAVGLLRVEPRVEAEKVEVSVNGGAFTRATAPVRLSQPGLHVLRYRPLGGKITTEVKILLLAVRGQLSPPAGPLKLAGEPALVSLDVKDERGRAAILPGLTVTAYPGGGLPLRYAGPGRYEAQLEPPQDPPPAKVWLVASWLGGELGRTEVKVQAPAKPAPEPPKPAPPTGFRWHSEPVAPEGALTSPGLPARSARPATTLGLSGFLARADGPDDPLLLRLSLRAGLALLDRRLGLDLDLPFAHLDLDHDRAGSNDMGDMRVGARYLALDRRGLALSPSLRVTIPTGRDLPRDRRSVLLEPAVLLEWTFKELLTLNTNQVLVVDLHTDQGTALHYAGTYSAEVRLFKRHLGLAAELDTFFGIYTPDAMQSMAAVAAAGAIRGYIGRVRLGLVGAGGITDDARRTLGQFSVGLTVDLGFLWP